MILCFDIGNSSTSGALFNETEHAPAFVFHFPTVKSSSEKDIAARVTRSVKEVLGDTPLSLSGMAFASVVPELNAAYLSMSEAVFGITAHEISCASRLNITIGYHDPAQLGADRIANAAAGFNEYGGDILIVDMGTAVTFCVILTGGKFDGGVIAPGIDTAIRGLAQRASRLPEVPIEKPDRVAARDTVNALKSGFYYGWISLVEGIISRIENEYGKQFTVIMTGGHAILFSQDMTRPHVVDTLLALKGIRLIYELNR